MRVSQSIHIVRPLLDHETFVLSETRVDAHDGEVRGVIKRLLQAGALEKHERERSTDSVRWRYRWQPDARQRYLDYLDRLDKMPNCDCRLHIPDGRDDPEGKLSCKYCGTMHDKDEIRERF